MRSWVSNGIQCLYRVNAVPRILGIIAGNFFKDIGRFYNVLLRLLSLGAAVAHPTCLLGLDGLDELLVVAEARPGRVVETILFLDGLFGNHAFGVACEIGDELEVVDEGLRKVRDALLGCDLLLQPLDLLFQSLDLVLGVIHGIHPMFSLL